MNCDEFRAAVIAGEENVATDAHLESCPACRSHAGELRQVAATLTDRTLWAEASPELGDQIESLIVAAAGSGERATAAGRRWWWAVAAAAAAFVIAAGSFVATRPPAPDWEVAMPATPLAPGASATVSGWNEEAGTRIVLTAEGLEPAPRGFIYEMWLSDGPVHISAGTFRTGGEVKLWAGVPRSDFPRLWVTLEPLDEDASPSVATVLDTGA